MFKYKLNMFEKGLATRQKLLDISLQLFRERGFDQTTMRDIAKAAGMATGAAYYHFPSKEAIVAAYYHTVQETHLAEMQLRLAAAATSSSATGNQQAGAVLRERLVIAYRTAIDVIAKDRMMLHVVMRTMGDREHPLSVLGPATEEVREMSREIYATALRGTDVPAEFIPLASRAAWALHMALVLYFFYDTSDGYARTYRLADQSAGLAAELLTAISSPMGQVFAKPLLARIERVLQEAAILPEPAAAAIVNQ